MVFGGLVFQPLSSSFYQALGDKPVALRYYYTQFLEEELYIEHPEVVVISKILPDPVNTYLNRFLLAIVDKVNGTKIRTLEDLAKAFAAPAEFYVLNLVADPQPLVLEAKAVQRANDRIRQRYGVTQTSHLTGGIVPPDWSPAPRNALTKQTALKPHQRPRPDR